MNRSDKSIDLGCKSGYNRSVNKTLSITARYVQYALVMLSLIAGCPGKKETRVQGRVHEPVVTTLFVKIKRNDHLQAALFRTTIDRTLAVQILDKLKIGKFPFRYCRPADSVYIERVDGRFRRFCYIKSPKEKYYVERDSLGLFCYMHFPYVERHLIMVRGRINSSIYETMLKMGETPELVYNFADIFAWEIDFFTETQQGDTLEVLVEKELADGRIVGYPAILYVRYKGYVGDYSGVYFDDPTGYDDYYNMKGESLRKSLLKSPLRYSRISSHFSANRLHPILRIYRPHHGMDYVAPAGTPVSSIGQGRVTFAGTKGGYGRLVEIRHPNGYKTRYGHLSKIAGGVIVGKHVSMGELIGYVGRSGLATGPHLHFEFYVNNSPINPLKIKIPRAPSVKNEYRELFEKEKKRIQDLAENLKKASKV